MVLHPSASFDAVFFDLAGGAQWDFDICWRYCELAKHHDEVALA